MSSPPSPPAARAGSLGVVGVLALTLGLTLARSLRWPNDFAEAHWLLDYRWGFVKRGLAGQLLAWGLAPFGTDVGATSIAVIAAIVLAALLGVMTWMVWRLHRAANGDPAVLLIGLALLSSPFVVMSGHLAGYLDGVIVLLALTAVLAMTGGRPWLAGVLTALAILVHESAVLVCLPAVALAWWRVGAGTRRRVVDGLPLLLPVAAFLAVALAGQLTPDMEDAYSARLAAAGFVGGDMHLFVPEWLRPGFVDAYRQNSHRFAERIAFAEMYGLMLPTILALVAWVVEAYRLPARSLTLAALPLVILAPELLHMAAWDTVRIWTYAIATTMLAVLAIARTADAPRPAGTVVRGLALVALVVNVMTMTPMLDNLADRYSLSSRLAMYAPVLAVAVWAMLARERSSRPRVT